MPETTVLKYDADPAVPKWPVPVPDGKTAEQVAEAWPGWSVDETADVNEVASEHAQAFVDAAPQLANDPAPQQPTDLDLHPVPSPDGAPHDDTTPEGN